MTEKIKPEWKKLMLDIEYREPDYKRPSIIYRFLLILSTTLNEAAYCCLQNDINIIFKTENGVARQLLNNSNVAPEISDSEVETISDGVFDVIRKPSPDSPEDLEPPVDAEKPNPFDNLVGDLVFQANRVELVSHFLVQLMDSFGKPTLTNVQKFKVYTVFGKPISTNMRLNMLTTRRLWAKIVDPLKEIDITLDE